MYKLVVVDDEQLILDGICDIFPWHSLGFNIVHKTTSAREALAYVHTHPVDVVMTDIVMPDMNGLEFAKELKQFPNLLVVILSSFSDYDYMREALRLNITDYILKPVNYENLTDYFQKAKETLDHRNRITEVRESSYYENIIQQVNEYLHSNYPCAKLGEAAERVSISANYLSKIYKDKCGIGFYEKLLRIRMEKAADMLGDPAVKAYEIASLVGYDNPKNFSRAFKSFYRVTPREYRNGLREPHD